MIPSVRPNLPRHLSREPVTPRPTKATLTSRELLNTARENERREADSFNSLTELVEKFPLNDMRYIVIKMDTNRTFSCLDVEQKPEVKYSLKLLSNLSYEMWCKGLHVKPKQIEEEPNKLPKQITSFMVLSKIVLLLEKRCDENMREMLNEEDLIEEDLIEEDLIKEDLIEEDLIEEDLIEEDLIEEDLIEEDLIEEDLIEEDLIEEDLIEEDLIEEDLIEEDLIEEDLIEEDLIEEDLIEEDLIEEDLIEEDLIEEDLIEEDLIEEDLIEEDLIEEDLIEEDLIEEVMELLKNPKLSCNKKTGFLMEQPRWYIVNPCIGVTRLHCLIWQLYGRKYHLLLTNIFTKRAFLTLHDAYFS